MKCPVCNGKGYYEVQSSYGTERVECGCHDTQTNEEWFCSLSTEEKAKRIINIAVNSDCDYRTIVEWLKQPHSFE